jgi:acyl dehydratase
VIGKTIAELREGDHAEVVRVIDGGDIGTFLDAVGDHNPVHSDPAFAATTRFREPIAPGIYTAGLISAVIGTVLPGPGAIYLSQDLKFLKPVRAGDTIRSRVEIAEIVQEKNRIRLKTVCTNQRDEDVLVGEAWVMPPPTGVVYEPRHHASPAAPWVVRPWAWAAEIMVAWSVLGLSALASMALLGARPTGPTDGTVGAASGRHPSDRSSGGRAAPRTAIPTRSLG